MTRYEELRKIGFKKLTGADRAEYKRVKAEHEGQLQTAMPAEEVMAEGAVKLAEAEETSGDMDEAIAGNMALGEFSKPLPAQPLDKRRLFETIREELRSGRGRGAMTEFIDKTGWVDEGGRELTDAEVVKVLFQIIYDGDERALIRRYFANVGANVGTNVGTITGTNATAPV